MKKSLFVAGLDFAITDKDLENLFNSYGTVESAKVITDRSTGRSRGFGFVDMSSQSEAESCISNLNNTSFKNRQIVVRLKEDRTNNSNDNRRSFSRAW